MAKLSSVDWNQANRHVTLTGNSGFLRLTTGQRYRIRSVSLLLRFYRLYRKLDGQIYTALPEERTDAYRPYGVTLSERYAGYVIDRADGKIKVLEAPKSVFHPIATHAEVLGQKPTDPQGGYDYAIQVTGTGLNTRYVVTPVSVAPLTNSEQDAVRTKTIQGLREIYKSHTSEQIRLRLKL